ncbi:hypothetical protein CC80DRAFT_554171 [Byssothecium circinans]|uniref:Uncharacterized protein n=1 Tax=Byssothecium circinans TaxID=147558 RepID=A0A6A5TG49_9PLEO|nr:hypothetical protein CC80DRAFT_554171 [Byssothecium circinans]
MGLRKTLRKATSDFFPAVERQKAAEDRRNRPSQQDRTPAPIDVIDSSVQEQPVDSEVNLDRRAWSKSWWKRRRSSTDTPVRSRKRLVKINPALQQPSELVPLETPPTRKPVRRSQSQRKPRVSLQHCTGNDTVAVTAPPRTSEMPGPRAISDADSKGRLAQRHSEDGGDGLRTRRQKASAPTPQRFFSMTSLNPPVFFDEHRISAGSNSAWSSNAALDDQSQSPGFDSRNTAPLSTSSTTPTKKAFSVPIRLTGSGDRMQLGRGNTSSSSAPPIEAAHTEPLGQSNTSGETPRTITGSPILIPDSSRSNSFTLRDSWCNPRLAKIFEKASEHSLILGPVDNPIAKSKDLRRDRRTVETNLTPSALSPFVPNFSHKVLSPVTRSIEKVDLLIDQALKDTEGPDNVVEGNKVEQIIPPTRKKASKHPRSPVCRTLSGSLSARDGRNARQKSLPDLHNPSVSYYKPSHPRPIVQDPASNIERQASRRSTDGNMINKWLQPTPLQSTSQARDTSSIDPKFNIQNAEKPVQNLQNSGHTISASRRRHAAPSPPNPERETLPNNHFKEPPPLPTTNEMQTTHLRSLRAPLPSSPAYSPVRAIPASLCPTSLNARGKQPIYDGEPETPLPTSHAEQIREAVLEGKNRLIRQSQLSLRQVVMARKSTEDLSSMDPDAYLSTTRSHISAFQEHKKSLSMPNITPETLGDSSSSARLQPSSKYPDTDPRYTSNDTSHDESPFRKITRSSSVASSLCSVLENQCATSPIRPLSPSPLPDISTHPAFASARRKISIRHSDEAPQRRLWIHENVPLREAGVCSAPTTPMKWAKARGRGGWAG